MKNSFDSEQLTGLFSYLDALRDSGITNMYGAVLYLESEFGISRKHANLVFTVWQKTFSGDKPPEMRAKEVLSL